MQYDIADELPPRQYKPRPIRYTGIDRLEIGEALKIPFYTLTENPNSKDRAGTIRAVAYYWSKRLNRRFRARIRGDYVFLLREEPTPCQKTSSHHTHT